MGNLTDRELKNLKLKTKLYKVTDGEGMHAAVTPTGVISFRYQYRVNGRQEVLTIGRYSAEAARKLTREPDCRDQIAFRDALRAAPTLRDRYAALKHDLVARLGGAGRGRYAGGKTDFVQTVIQQAR